MLAGGGFGLRAFCNIPRGVEEVVMEGVVVASAVDRREGTRGVFALRGEWPTAGDSTSLSVDVGDFASIAKSIESSGAPCGLGSGKEAMMFVLDSPVWHGR